MQTDNLPAARVELPTPTPQVAASLSPQQLQEHRARIGTEVAIVLSGYFQPNEAEQIRAGQLAWWCDELQDWTHEQVVWGLRKWNRENPRLRPTPGDIVRILKAERGRQKAGDVRAMRETYRDEAERVTREAAAEIMRRAKISPRGAAFIAQCEAELRRAGVHQMVSTAVDALLSACDEYGLTFTEIRGPHRDRHHVAARDMAVRVMIDAGMSVAQIAKAINRDRSSVEASLQRSEVKK